MATEEQVQQRIQQALQAERERELNARIAAVSIKLPKFWPDKTRFWFAQAEVQFKTKGITVEKKSLTMSYKCWIQKQPRRP